MTNAVVELRRAANSIFTAADQPVAGEISAALVQAANEIERLRNIITGCPVCSELERNIQPSLEPEACSCLGCPVHGIPKHMTGPQVVLERVESGPPELAYRTQKSAPEPSAYLIPTAEDYCKAHGRYPCSECNAQEKLPPPGEPEVRHVTAKQTAPDGSHFCCPSCGVRLNFPAAEPDGVLTITRDVTTVSPNFRVTATVSEPGADPEVKCPCGVAYLRVEGGYVPVCGCAVKNATPGAITGEDSFRNESSRPRELPCVWRSGCQDVPRCGAASKCLQISRKGPAVKSEAPLGSREREAYEAELKRLRDSLAQRTTE